MNNETTQAVQAAKKVKLKTDSLRVKRETKKKILNELASLNRKDFGRSVTADDYVALAITLLRPEHLDNLKEGSLSNKDRMEKRYKEYCDKNGKVTRDEFIGLLLSSDFEKKPNR